MAIFRGSRYQPVLVYSHLDSSGSITPTLSRRSVPAALSDLTGRTYKTHIWDDSSRIDILAYNEYGDSGLWWAILDANPQYMTPFDIQTGDMLKIPPYEVIRGVLGNG